MRGVVVFIALVATCGAAEHQHAAIETVPMYEPPPAAPPPPPPSEPLVTDEGGLEHCHCFGPETGGMKPECLGAVCRCYAAGKPLCPDGYLPGSELPCGQPAAGR